MINSNPLLQTYDGCIGVKTGFTDAAHYCLSAAAQRDGSTFIAVCLGAVTISSRNDECQGMLDYGFANYKTVTPQAVTVPAQTLPVELGLYDKVQTQPITLNFTPLLVPSAVDPVVGNGLYRPDFHHGSHGTGRPGGADYRDPQWGKPLHSAHHTRSKGRAKRFFGLPLAPFGSKYLECKTWNDKQCTPVDSGVFFVGKKPSSKDDRLFLFSGKGNRNSAE